MGLKLGLQRSGTVSGVLRDSWDAPCETIRLVQWLSWIFTTQKDRKRQRFTTKTSTLPTIPTAIWKCPLLYPSPSLILGCLTTHPPPLTGTHPWPSFRLNPTRPSGRTRRGWGGPKERPVTVLKNKVPKKDFYWVLSPPCTTPCRLKGNSLANFVVSECRMIRVTRLTRSTGCGRQRTTPS